MDSKDDDDWMPPIDVAGSILAPLGLCLMIMFIYIILGSLVLIRLEPWSFIDCCFFCFMSLSTINLSDSLIYRGNVNNLTIWIASMYILTGLALTAMCFNILHEELLKRLKKQIMKGLRIKKDPVKVVKPGDGPSPDLFSTSWQRDPEPETKMALQCEIVAIKHRGNLDAVNSTVPIEKMCNSTFKNVDCSVGTVFTLPQSNE